MDYRQLVEQAVEANRERILELSDAIFDYAEIGFREFRSVEQFTRMLQEDGFEVTCGLDGMPTAFRASYGSGRPLIGLLAEYDALPDLSQKAGSDVRCPADGPVTDGHGCGHNLLGAGCYAAALALKEYLAQNPGKGTVVLYGCPSEEKGCSKTHLARDGFFDEMDIAYAWHPFAVTEAATYSMLANVSVFFRFKGITSHAAAAPHMGRSALDAAELMSVGVNYLREHIVPEARIHYAYRDVGGIAPNVVQGTSCVHYFVRAPKNYQVQEILPRVVDVARGAALMTGTEMSWELYSGLSDLIVNRVVTEGMHEALCQLGMPELTEEDWAFARRMFLAADSEEALQMKIDRIRAEYGDRAEEILEHPVDMEIRTPVWNGQCQMGSSDVGDASYIAPLAFLSLPTAVVGTSTHTWQMTAQGKGPIAHKMVLHAGKVMALAAIGMYEDPDKVAAARAELLKATGGRYDCPLPKELRPRLEEG
ncbi:MAG: amidohydrolase [Oscillospiraceae bacterium]|nr:amidohydrolase [Oscillospiraceae bacterium]